MELKCFRIFNFIMSECFFFFNNFTKAVIHYLARLLYMRIGIRSFIPVLYTHHTRARERENTHAEFLSRHARKHFGIHARNSRLGRLRAASDSGIIDV